MVTIERSRVAQEDKNNNNHNHNNDHNNNTNNDSYIIDSPLFRNDEMKDERNNTYGLTRGNSDTSSQVGLLSDDDESFYDCEEGHILSSLGMPHTSSGGLNSLGSSSSNISKSDFNMNNNFAPRSPIRNSSGIISNGDISSGTGTDSGDDAQRMFSLSNIPTPQKLHSILTRSSQDATDDYYDHTTIDGNGKNKASPRNVVRTVSEIAPDPHAPVTVKDIAVTLVEMLLVIFEFSYWRIYGIYQYDMKEAFNVSLNHVSWRALMSFVPGRHSDIIQKPDIYGPLLAALTLPLVVLMCLQVNELGCKRTEMLHSSVITSLCLWIGLSTLYQVVGWLLAPPIRFTHCLCMVGYSFYSWMLAMSCSYFLEVVLGLDRPHSVPLIIFGIPSSVSLGILFWELTPASGVTLRPSAFPSSLQSCVMQHSRLLQRFTQLIPKLLGFIFVTATHYQFLWYLARVFLPGRRQMCRLSAIISPAAYADILTQKELLSFAEWLLATGK